MFALVIHHFHPDMINIMGNIKMNADIFITCDKGVVSVVSKIWGLRNIEAANIRFCFYFEAFLLFESKWYTWPLQHTLRYWLKLIHKGKSRKTGQHLPDNCVFSKSNHVSDWNAVTKDAREKSDIGSRNLVNGSRNKLSSG